VDEIDDQNQIDSLGSSNSQGVWQVAYLLVDYEAQQKSILGHLKKSDNSIVVDKTPDPASRAPDSMTATARLLLQFMRAELSPKAKSL